MSAGSKIGNNCVIESFSGIHHDQTIGNNVFIATNVAFAGSKIGDNSLICDGVTIGLRKLLKKLYNFLMELKLKKILKKTLYVMKKITI